MSDHDKPSPDTACRADGRCQYAIDHGAEGLGHCPVGECAQPSDPADIYEEEYTTQSSVGGTHEHSHRAALAAVVAAFSAPSATAPQRGDPMENWLMKPALEWLEQAEHGENQQRCKMIADLLRDLWRGPSTGVTSAVTETAPTEGVPYVATLKFDNETRVVRGTLSDADIAAICQLDGCRAQRAEEVPPKRYNIQVWSDGEWDEVEDKDGDWVRWSDIASHYGPSQR